MPMRAEILGVVWLAAITSAGWAAMRAFDSAPPIPDEPLAEVVSAPPPRAGVLLEAARAVPSDAAPGRPLFRLSPAVVVPQQAVAVAPAAPLPQLRGIIERDREARAVFLIGGDGIPRYEVVGVGMSLGGISILSIDRDGVVAETPEGGAVRLRLRGAGEK
jgi:hypothetical protein